MATITLRTGLGRNLTAAEVDANFTNINTELAGVSGLVVQDEGSPLATAASTLNFVGSGISVSGSGAVKTITVLAGGDALTSQPLSQFAATTSAQLAALLTDETGTGPNVFANNATLVAPALGAATATTINKVTFTPPATAATLGLIDGTVVTGPAASGTIMTLGNAETITGVKTFGSAGAVGKLKVAGTTSGAITIDAAAVAGAFTVTLPAATDTLVGKATTDTFTNKTYDTAGGGNSFSINGVAVTANTGTGAVARAASPSFSGAVGGTFTLPATVTLVSSPSQADNSLKIASTAYVDTGLATKVTANATVALGTGSGTLVQATHSNRHLTATPSSAASWAMPAGTTGDYIELANNGTAIITITGCTSVPGFKEFADPGEVFFAVYTGAVWKSLVPQSPGTSAINSISAAYSIVAQDAGKTLYHPSADTTARVWTLPANASIPFPIGTVITFDNDDGAGALTIAITTDTLVLVGTAGTTGSRTLAEGGRAVAQKVTATRWRISGGSELT